MTLSDLEQQYRFAVIEGDLHRQRETLQAIASIARDELRSELLYREAIRLRSEVDEKLRWQWVGRVLSFRWGSTRKEARGSKA